MVLAGVLGAYKWGHGDFENHLLCGVDGTELCQHTSGSVWCTVALSTAGSTTDKRDRKGSPNSPSTKINLRQVGLL